jgi:hypothetical protein
MKAVHGENMALRERAVLVALTDNDFVVKIHYAFQDKVHTDMQYLNK